MRALWGWRGGPSISRQSGTWFNSPRAAIHTSREGGLNYSPIQRLCSPGSSAATRESSGPHRESARVWAGEDSREWGVGSTQRRKCQRLTASTSGLHCPCPPLPPHGPFISFCLLIPSVTCLALSFTVWLNTVQMTPWAQGGVVRDPSYRK